jgi:5-methyltetrahydrofolate--homocysteine methyltransferase
MTPEALLARLEQRPLLLDGGMGSMLIAAGLDAGRAPEWWLFEHPENIVDAHRRYVEAGADVIHAVTFGGTEPKLAAVGLTGRCAEVAQTAVAIAREAAGGACLVAGDLGPTGKFLPPMGAATEDEFAAAFREQADALAEAGADLLSIETMYDLREARLAVSAAAATGLPVLASMTFEVRPRGHFTIMGDRLVPTLRALVDAGAHVVGFNCSVVSDQMVPMVVEAVAGVDAPIEAQPNAGAPRATTEGVVYDADPEAFVRDLLAMVDAGARVVGGCCGSDPGFIARARAALDARP